MTASGIVEGLLLTLITVVLTSDAVMSGVCLGAAAGRARPAWRILGPIPLLATVWLVVLVAWAQTGFPATETAVWTDAPGAAALAVLAAAARLALVVLAPLLPDRATRLPLAATGTASLIAWPLLAVGVGRLPPWQGWTAGAVLATLAVVAGRSLVHARPSRRVRAIRVLSLGAGIAVAALGGLALVPASTFSPSADPHTLQVLAEAGGLTLPLTIVLQLLTLRVLGLRAASADWPRRLTAARPPIGEPR